MNFLALAQRLHAETLNSTAAPTTAVGATGRPLRLFNAVADAWMELQSERPWRWMRGTTDAPLTVGLQTYAPADLGITRFGRWRKDEAGYQPYLYIATAVNSLWPLDYWELEDFRWLYLYQTQGQTTPVAWSFDEQDQLLVGPAPALAYKLRAEYWREPAAFTLDADEPDMPSRFHMWLVWRALQDIARQDAKPELLSKAETNAGALHDKLLFDQARLPTL